MDRHRYINALVVISLLAILGCASQVLSSRVGNRSTLNTPISLQETRANIPVLRRQASPLYFLNHQIGWVLHSNTLYGTIDGGKTWTALNHREAQSFKKVTFSNEQDGWAISDEWGTKQRSNSIFCTRDGGRSWQRVLDVPTPIYAMVFPSERVGYVSPRWYPIHRTPDGGNTWEKVDGTEGLNYIYFISEKEGWGYGSAVWHTNDSGQTWTQDVPYEPVSDLYSADFIDKSTGWIVGKDRQVWHTTDGRIWRLMTNVLSTERDFYDVDFINRDEGWITVENGMVLYTKNGGETWQVITRRPHGLTVIRFTSQREGWALDTKDNLLHTIDSGKTWKEKKDALLRRQVKR